MAWTLAALILAGIVMVFSSSAVYAQETYQDSFYLLKRHITWVLLGTGLLIFARKFDYHKWEKLTLPIMPQHFFCCWPLWCLRSARKWAALDDG